MDVSRERYPDQAEHFHPVERDQQGVGGVPSSLEVQPTEAPVEVIPLPPGLIPIPGQGAEEEQPPAQISRRASIDPSRTVSEPEPLPTATPLENSQPLEPIAEEPGTEEPRPSKAPRREPSAAAAATPDRSSERNTRAPGSPVGPLMQIVNNRDPPPPYVPPEDRDPLTPGEDLSGTEGRVQHQATEFQRRAEARERSPRRSTASSSTTRPAPEVVDLTDLYTKKVNIEAHAQFFSTTRDFISDYQGGWCFMAKRGDEISLKDLSLKEKELFDQSDQAEWQAILSTKAVRVITGGEADRVRRLHQDRIISSRMVRTWMTGWVANYSAGLGHMLCGRSLDIYVPYS